MPSHSSDKDAYLERLRRIEGQVSAATNALRSFSLELLDEHLATCVLQAAAADGEEADLTVREASEAIARLVRS